MSDLEDKFVGSMLGLALGEAALDSWKSGDGSRRPRASSTPPLLKCDWVRFFPHERATSLEVIAFQIEHPNHDQPVGPAGSTDGKVFADFIRTGGWSFRGLHS